MAIRVRSFFCRHKLWVAHEPIITDLEEDRQSVTWRRMECAGCGKIRHTAMLKPGEEVVVSWEGMRNETF